MLFNVEADANESCSVSVDVALICAKNDKNCVCLCEMYFRATFSAAKSNAFPAGAMEPLDKSDMQYSLDVRVGNGASSGGHNAQSPFHLVPTLYVMVRDIGHVVKLHCQMTME